MIRLEITEDFLTKRICVHAEDYATKVHLDKEGKPTRHIISPHLFIPRYRARMRTWPAWCSLPGRCRTSLMPLSLASSISCHRMTRMQPMQCGFWHLRMRWRRCGDCRQAAHRRG